MVKRTTLWLSLLAGAGLAAACDEDDGRGAEATGATECVGAKCDVPTGEAEDLCGGRRDAAFTTGKEAFTSTGLRWSCNDVAGVTVGDRGQEYCEYWAIARIGDDQYALGRADRGSGESDVGIDFTDAQRETLEDTDPTEVVAACMFSSWNGDQAATCAECKGILGFEATTDNFQARKNFNSLGAAEDLLRECTGKDAIAGGVRDDAFYRGCLHAHDAFGTGWRKSDATICAAAVALDECSCELKDGSPLTALALPNEPGFRLGSWDDASGLPSGCHYVAIDDGSAPVVVACEVTAADVLDHGQDLKTFCRESFAERVVVHVPIDPSAVQCDASCDAQPWVLRDGE
ncbi:MAG: hypothetical protein AAF721_20325 [Myxococcota bacterium]